MASTEQKPLKSKIKRPETKSVIKKKKGINEENKLNFKNCFSSISDVHNVYDLRFSKYPVQNGTECFEKIHDKQIIRS